MADPADPLVETVLDDPRWAALGLEALAERAARAALESAGVDPEGCEISLLGADDARMAELNAAFRDKAKATNVLSWPSGETEADPDGARFLGDVALAWETCMAEAEAGGIAPADHVTHLVAHGVLHLLGFDHELEAEADAMEALETKILARLGVADPYRG
jgi:probable rRNA maturation factor